MFLFQPQQQDPLLRDNYRQEGLSASSEEQQGKHRGYILIIVSFRAMDLSIIYDRLSVLELVYNEDTEEPYRIRTFNTYRYLPVPVPKILEKKLFFVGILKAKCRRKEQDPDP